MGRSSFAIAGALAVALTFGHVGNGLRAQAPGAAVTADKAGPFGALKWRGIGPARGGRSIAVAGSAARPNEYYFGATGGGLWKTTNGGVTWSPVTDSQLSS